MEKETFFTRLKHAWNIFKDDSKQTTIVEREAGYGSYYRPNRHRLSRGGERSIIVAILNRIAMDAASVDIRHVRLDESDRFVEEMHTDLNNCLTCESNIDQSSRAFVQDIVLSMLDEGVVAVVPIQTTFNPIKTGAYDIQTMRVGKIVQWYPSAIRVNLYDDQTGKHVEKVIPKRIAAIIENPFYAVMNEPNSMFQRLARKLALLDIVDEASSSGKLNMIIQLPYIIKSEARKEQADRRRDEIEKQLAESKYGIAYTDGTEKIQQIGRPIENNLLQQIEFLQNTVYSQLGMTPEILNGSANVDIMNNYYNRTIEPILAAIVDEMTRKFLTKTARTKKQRIKYFKDPFKLVSVSTIAEMADKFTRNEILSSNEFRQIIGFKPANDPKADQLINSNIAQPLQGLNGQYGQMDPNQMSEEDIYAQLADIDRNEQELDDLERELGQYE